MKKSVFILIISTLVFFNLDIYAQCTDSNKPLWSPSVPNPNVQSGDFNYPLTAAIGSVIISPSGTNSFSDPSTTNLFINTAFFTKQGLQTVVITFNTLITKATKLTPTAVSMVSTNESFKLSSINNSEGQIVSATDASGVEVFPIWANMSSVTITGINNNEITGNSASGSSEFSFNVPIKTLTIKPIPSVIATTTLNVILYPVCASTSLPVELTFFKAKSINNVVKLSWQTASEKNNKGFEIERSMDTKTWENIGEVKGQGTSDIKVDYNFEDKHPLSILTYYRLKQVDFDGKESYSNIESVSIYKKNVSFEVYPNPVNNREAIITFDEDLLEGTFTIINSIGSVVKKEKISTKNPSLNLSDLTTGIYIFNVQKGSNFVSKKIIIAE
jgi:Secretion system C-terminal sorting domain